MAGADMPQLERCTVVLDGVVTLDATRRVADELGRLGPGSTLRLDLTWASEVQAVVLGRLVCLLEARRTSLSVQFVGLRQRDCRILRYLGFEIDPAGRSDGSPEARSQDS